MSIRLILSVFSFLFFSGQNLYAESCNRTAKNLFCVGDSVISIEIGNVFSGEVLKVSMSGIQVETDSWGEKDTILNMKQDDLYLMSGCLQLTCVGDIIFRQGYSVGQTVLALNPSTQSIVISQSGGWAGIPIELATLSFGCSGGVCVGDQASKVLPGQIIGIVPNQSEIVVYSRKDYPRAEYAWTKNLYVSKINPEYTADQRKKPIFPEIDESKYAIPELKFSKQRPVKN